MDPGAEAHARVEEAPPGQEDCAGGPPPPDAIEGPKAAVTEGAAPRAPDDRRGRGLRPHHRVAPAAAGPRHPGVDRSAGADATAQSVRHRHSHGAHAPGSPRSAERPDQRRRGRRGGAAGYGHGRGAVRAQRCLGADESCAGTGADGPESATDQHRTAPTRHDDSGREGEPAAGRLAAVRGARLVQPSAGAGGRARSKSRSRRAIRGRQT